MANKLKTLSHIEITTSGIVLNDERLETTGNGLDMLTHAYRSYVNDYPKFFKMDGLGKLGFLASELLLKSLHEERFVSRDDRAVILLGSSGSRDADIHFQSTISDNDNFFPSPSVFVYTLPNIVTGEIAIRNKYLGETAFYVISHYDESVIEQLLMAAFQDDATKSVLTGWVDYSDKEHFEAKLKLINRT